MKIISSHDIKAIDKKTIDEENIDSVNLMDRAASKIAEAIIHHYKGGRIYIFAGAGNNGGDAIAAGILLHKQGFNINIIHFVINELSADCDTVRKRLTDYPGIPYTEVSKSFTKPDITKDDLIIDGLFGSGLNKPLSGGFAAVANFINSTGATVFSIDLPSGLMCEDNTYNVMQNVIKADRTFTIQYPKLVFFFSEFSKYIGDYEVLDIKLSEKAISECNSDISTIEAEDVRKIIRKRNRFTHKGDYGKALVIAGSYGMAGAAILTAKGCLKSGVGLLKIHIPSACVNVIQTAVPEAIACIDYHEHIFTSLFEENDATVTAIGPGLGTDELTAEGLKQVIRTASGPMVIDADAINIISANRDIFKYIPKKSILTPHIKEFDRLTGNCQDPYERILKAAELAKAFNVYIVLKSAYTFVITPENKFYINTNGNPGMATGGSGDVLTGVITALLAQGYSSQEAAILGTYAHGLAGDIAASKLGEMGMTSMDIAENLPEAWKRLENDEL